MYIIQRCKYIGAFKSRYCFRDFSFGERKFDHRKSTFQIFSFFLFLTLTPGSFIRRIIRANRVQTQYVFQKPSGTDDMRRPEKRSSRIRHVIHPAERFDGVHQRDIVSFLRERIQSVHAHGAGRAQSDTTRCGRRRRRRSDRRRPDLGTYEADVSRATAGTAAAASRPSRVEAGPTAAPARTRRRKRVRLSAGQTNRRASAENDLLRYRGRRGKQNKGGQPGNQRTTPLSEVCASLIYRRDFT